MSQSKKLINELNKLLKGTNIGIFVFDNLSEKISNHKLKSNFSTILKKLKRHETMLINQIRANDGEEENSAGIMGTISDILIMIKNLKIINDIQVTEEAIKSIEMGLKAIEDFKKEHQIVDTELKKEIFRMEKDYIEIYQILNTFQINYK